MCSLAIIVSPAVSKKDSHYFSEAKNLPCQKSKWLNILKNQINFNNRLDDYFRNRFVLDVADYEYEVRITKVSLTMGSLKQQIIWYKIYCRNIFVELVFRITLKWKCWNIQSHFWCHFVMLLNTVWSLVYLHKYLEHFSNILKMRLRQR